MKRIAIALLVVFALVSCSKDETESAPADGQYVAYYLYDNDFLICADIVSGKCAVLTIFNSKNNTVRQLQAIDTTGEWPNYVYSKEEGITISATFDSAESFSGFVTGHIASYENDGSYVMVISTDEAPMTFRRSDKVLDANGDGILDERQF